MAQSRQQPILQERGQGSPEDGYLHSTEETEIEETTRCAAHTPWIGRTAMLTVGCALLAASWHFHAQRGLPTGTPEHTVQLSDASQSSQECEDMFEWIIQAQIPVKFADYDFSTQSAKDLPFQSAAEAASLLKDPETNAIWIGMCAPDEKSVVWFYPHTKGDRDGAFLLAGGECRRMDALMDQADCVAIYRVPQVQEIAHALEKYHGAGSILHAVLGGHGSDSAQDAGLLALFTSDEGAHTGLSASAAEFTSMLGELRVRLAPQATVFLDSCFAGINGVAKTVSSSIPEHWVFGGVVSLTSLIKTTPAPFDGGPDGPVRVVSEYADATVLNIPAVNEGKKDPAEIALAGYEIGDDVDEAGNPKMLLTQTFSGERLIGWYGGNNQGSVIQWLRPSNNSQVIRTGLKVSVKEELSAFRLAIAGGGLTVFPDTMLPGMTGTVTSMMNGGNVVTSGNAVITFDLPGDWVKTEGSGASTGPVVVMSTDFWRLDVVEDSSVVSPSQR